MGETINPTVPTQGLAGAQSGIAAYSPTYWTSGYQADPSLITDTDTSWYGIQPSGEYLSDVDYYRQRFPNVFTNVPYEGWKYKGRGRYYPNVYSSNEGYERADPQNIIRGSDYIYGFTGGPSGMPAGYPGGAEDYYSPWDEGYETHRAWERIGERGKSLLQNDYDYWRRYMRDANKEGRSPSEKAYYEKLASILAGKNKGLFEKEYARNKGE